MIKLTVDGSYNNKAEGASRMGLGILIETATATKKLAVAWDTDSTTVKAEYQALIHGLSVCLSTHTERNIRIYMDAQVIVRQVTGRYQVRNPTIQPYYSRVMALLAMYESFTIQHIPRKQNTICDQLSRLI